MKVRSRWGRTAKITVVPLPFTGETGLGLGLTETIAELVKKCKLVSREDGYHAYLRLQSVLNVSRLIAHFGSRSSTEVLAELFAA